MITYRSEKGSALSIDEIDQNFSYLEEIALKGIVSVEQDFADNVVRFVSGDGVVVGSFELPDPSSPGGGGGGAGTAAEVSYSPDYPNFWRDPYNDWLLVPDNVEIALNRLAYFVDKIHQRQRSGARSVVYEPATNDLEQLGFDGVTRVDIALDALSIAAKHVADRVSTLEANQGGGGDIGNLDLGTF